jgi:transposase-like protein
MAWGVKKVEEKRKQFILECKSSQIAISDLCQSYNISRTTAYKWLNRFHHEGESGLFDRSRARKTQPQQTPKEIIDLYSGIKI